MPSPLRSALLLLLLANTAAAQAQVSEPRVVADSFFRFLSAERYRDAAKLLDLEAFDAGRRLTLANAYVIAPPRHFTAADLRRSDPKMPRAVAEYQAKRMNASRFDVAPALLYEYGVSTVDSLRSLDVVDLATHWLESRDMRTMMRQSLRKQRASGCGISADSIEKLIARIQMSPAQVLGAVIEDSTAWVLYDHPQFVGDVAAMPGSAADSSVVPLPTRSAEREWQVVPPSILVAHRVSGRWRLVPTADSWSSMGVVEGCGRGTAHTRSREPRGH